MNYIFLFSKLQLSLYCTKPAPIFKINDVMNSVTEFLVPIRWTKFLQNRDWFPARRKIRYECGRVLVFFFGRKDYLWNVIFSFE